jgi:hypothetical protein
MKLNTEQSNHLQGSTTTMPLPTDNRHFERGDFKGFVTQGMCQIAKSFDAFQGTRTFHPVAGDFFALLEDPRRIDGDGVRALGPGDPKPISLSHLTFMPDAAGQTTLANDGAVLECRDVTIEVGQALWFHWAFARFDWSPANDFAVFAAYSEDGDDDLLVFKVCLAQSLELERQNRWSTNWEAFAWRPTTKFTGTLRWMVVNGISTSVPLPRPGGNARPSALLLDCVDLT